MHGLINRSIESFLRDTYGDSFWSKVAEAAGVAGQGFQTIRDYPDSISQGLFNHAALNLDKPEVDLLEDLGAWLARLEPIRRLLRFSGRDFTDFLHTLDELQGRAHMVVPDLGLPKIKVYAQAENEYRIEMPDCFREWRSVMAGVIRSMADDHGVLGLIAVEGNSVIVRISHDAFSEGRGFELAGAPIRLGGTMA